MATAHAKRTIRLVEIVSTPCPQCGFSECVRDERSIEGDPRRFLTCPHCGYTEEQWRSQHRQWKGYGVYVIKDPDGRLKGRAFPRPVPEERVPEVVAHFLSLGAVVQSVTRWNDHTNALEVLLGDV